MLVWDRDSYAGSEHRLRVSGDGILHHSDPKSLGPRDTAYSVASIRRLQSCHELGVKAKRKHFA